MESSETIGARIKALRIQSGMTQEEFACHSYIQRPYMSRIECGKANVRLDLIKRIAAGLGITASELVEGL